jgi:hypothetical protein
MQNAHVNKLLKQFLFVKVTPFNQLINSCLIVLNKKNVKIIKIAIILHKEELLMKKIVSVLILMVLVFTLGMNIFAQRIQSAYTKGFLAPSDTREGSGIITAEAGLTLDWDINLNEVQNTYCIKNVWTGKYLDAPFSTNNISEVLLKSFYGGNNQQWTLVDIPNTLGTYAIKNGYGKVLQVGGGLLAPVYVNNYNGQIYQQFHIGW